MKGFEGDGGEVQCADPTARRRAIFATAILAVVGCASIILTERWFAGLRELAREDPGQAIASLATFVRWFAAVVSLSLVGCAAYMFEVSRRIRRDLRFPPLGMPLVRETPVLHGAAAIARARWLTLLAAALLAASVAMPRILVDAVETL